MISLRSWFGLFGAIAHRRELPASEAAYAMGLPWRCGGHYGFGVEVGRG
jgi:hypothetical protein